ncbi:MAG: flagellar biosynthesis protein FlhB [Gammaproteobacteria bacterium]
MADDQGNTQEKTEQATPKRLDEARGKGQISRSRELSTMSVLLLGSSSLFFLGENIIDNLLGIMHDGFVISREHIFSRQFINHSFADAAVAALQGVSPLFITLLLVALLAPMAVGGWVFSAGAMAFQWEKLDPVKGIKRVFGARGLMELAKALAKFTVISGLAVAFLWLKVDDLLLLGHNGLRPGMAEAGNVIARAFVYFSSATILIAAVDVPFQLWEHSRQLKMTKQEVKDEMKETEGKPEVKSHIREMQQKLANQRMLEEVPKADVIITNPTHYAVALSYEQEKMGAPRVVARGVDFMAQRIRLVAGQHDVTIFSAPLLARALYFNTGIGREIPTGLYLAVAQVLAYVYQLKASRKDPEVMTPAPPGQIPIPDEYLVPEPGAGSRGSGAHAVDARSGRQD